MVEVAYRLSIEDQRNLVDLCRQVIQEAPLFQKTMPNGGIFHYLCTSAGRYGWISDRQGYRYVENHPLTGQHFPPMPTAVREIAFNAAVHYGLTMRPESALINWYGADGSLGLHQDKTEISRAPVISISLGDDCVFIVGGLKRSERKHDMILKSGDVLVMGAEHRLVFHGVKKILPNTAPPELEFKQAGRINITVRQVYD